MRAVFATLLLFGCACVAASEPQIAEQKSFEVPLANGSTGSAIVIAVGSERLVIVVAPTEPPTVGVFRLLPADAGPRPGPQPQPQPEPKPQPQPRGPLSLFWIEETRERTPDQARAITDAAIRAKLRAAGWSLRVADVDVVDEHGKTPEELANYVAAAKRLGVPRLFVVDAAGAEIYSGKAPANREEFLAVLRRLGLVVEEPTPPPAPQSNAMPCSSFSRRY